MNKTIPLTSEQKKVLVLSSLGGVLEFYDFIIYIFLTPFIEKIFFADSTTYIATLKTLAIFSIGYLFRPFGGIIFSHFGDRYGRKVVFLLTVLFMAIPCFAIGLLPSPTQIGILAPILLLFFRMIQGLSLGGEIPAAITFVSEHVQDNQRGFALATLFFGINLGLLLGSLTTAVITSYLTQQQMLDFGWRIPFILGGLFGVISIYLRRYLHETKAFSDLSKQDLQKYPLVTLLRKSPLNVLQGFWLVSIGSVTIFLYLYWPQYLNQYLQYDYSQMMKLNTLGTLILSVTIIIGGILGDKLGYRRMYLISALGLIILTYPLFYLFTLRNMTLVVVCYTLFSLIFGLIPSSYAAILSKLFPTEIRYSGISMSYNLSYALFGGLSPILCTYAIHTFNSVTAPAFYVITIAMIAGCVCYLGGKYSQINTLEDEAISKQFV